MRGRNTVTTAIDSYAIFRQVMPAPIAHHRTTMARTTRTHQ
jgi:hypothetical protein